MEVRLRGARETSQEVRFSLLRAPATFPPLCLAPRPQGLVQAWAAWDALLPLEVLLLEHPELYTPGLYRMPSEPKEVISITSIDPFIENKNHHTFP